MPFKIRTKLIVAFFGIIFPFIILFGIIALYNVNNIRKATLRAQTISGEMHAVMSLQIALDKALMPANDYIITGDKKYIDDFKTASKGVEDSIKNVDESLLVLKGMYTPEIKEEVEISKTLRTAWQKIKEISQKIFESRNPVGNKEAATLMEEMDYKWAYPAISMLDRHHEIDRKEYYEALEDVNRAWILAWIIMLAGGLMLAAAGVFFTVYYSNIFVRPISTLHNGADKIAAGDFKARVDVKTGDELEQLSIAMNEMAAQLDSLYSNLEQKVEERTMELKESESKYRRLIENSPDIVYTFSVKRGGIYYSSRVISILGYSVEHLYANPFLWNESIHPEDRVVVAKAIEEFKTGSPFMIEYRIRNAQGDWRWFYDRSIGGREENGDFIIKGLAMDITERKMAEEKIKEQMDFLDRFHRATVDRELRMHEIMEENEKLKKMVGEMEKKG